ncbi:hypothetical protein C8R46DRAFT_1065753 [Mycena filopes]|nr:hypothetical protein C8R46DRAFT_1065753 [Mycena filopes]
MAAEVKNAEAPFSGAPDPDGNRPEPDFILRSGDNIDLHVHKDILRFASVFFKDLFSSADVPIAVTKDGRPVLVLPESGDALYRLLCVAYPGTTLDTYALGSHNLDGIWAVHETANKYLFLDAQSLVERMLEAPALLASDPHRIFAIARLRGLRGLAQKAALSTLNSSVCPKGIRFPEMELLTAASMQRLYEFHHTCSFQAHDIALTHLEQPDGPGEHLYSWWEASGHRAGCGPSERDRGMGNVVALPAPWFSAHIKRLSRALQRVPSRQTLGWAAFAVSGAERDLIEACEVCKLEADDDLQRMAEVLGTALEANNASLAEFQGILGF